MSRKPPGGKKSTPLSFEFNGHVLTVIEIDGRLHFIAKEVGAALEYSEDGAKLARMISQEWANEFIEGEDFIKLVNGALAAVKAMLNQGRATPLIDPRTPSLLLLTMTGVQLVCMKTEKAEGVEFRKTIRFKVIPEWEAARRGEALPGAEAPQLDGQSAAPPTPPAPRRSRSHRPASSYGTARDLLELLDRYRRGRVIDAGAWHALRALAEHLDARPTPETIALPRTSTHRLLLGPVAGDLDAQIAAVLGPPPPEDSLRSSTYTTTAAALKVGAECRARRARGELSEFTNMHRWFALNVWIGWIQRGHLSVERFDLLLTRIEDLADELIGPMPSLRTTGGR